MAEIIEIENLTVDDSIELELEPVPQVDIEFDGEVETIELEDFAAEGIAVENDPTVPKHVKNISQDNIAFWNGWETITNLEIERICAL